jgi:hypothetical protein
MTENELWLQRFRLGIMAFLEQEVSKAQDAQREGDDRVAAKLHERQRTLKHFEARVSERQKL